MGSSPMVQILFFPDDGGIYTLKDALDRKILVKSGMYIDPTATSSSILIIMEYSDTRFIESSSFYLFSYIRKWFEHCRSHRQRPDIEHATLTPTERGQRIRV